MTLQKYLKIIKEAEGKKFTMLDEVIYSKEPPQLFPEENEFILVIIGDCCNYEVIEENYAFIRYFNCYSSEVFKKYCQENNIDADEIERMEFENSFNKFMAKYMSTRVENIKQRIVESASNVSRLQEQLMKAVKEYNEAKLDEHKVESIEEHKVKMKKEIDLIKTHKKVKRLELETDSFIDYIKLKVAVKDLILLEPEEEERYKIADTIIELGLSNGGVRFYPENQDDKLLASGYWTSKQLHPHVDETGKPCLGNAGQQFAVFASEGEYYAMFLTALNFLQTSNLQDAAGERTRNWAMCDEEGNVTSWPTEDEDYKRCHICNEEGYYEDMYYCEECNEYVCEGHAVWIESEGRYVCETCHEDYYVTCHECAVDRHMDDMCFDNEEDRWYCEDCWVQR